MVQRLRFLGVGVLFTLGFMIVGAIFIQSAYACTIIGATLSSSTITQGTPSVILDGKDPCSRPDDIEVRLYSGACPGVTFISSITVPTVSNYFSGTVISTSSLTPGSYCVQVDDLVDPVVTLPLTVTPAAIPEYPLGLAVLAVFMILAYGVVRRRTRDNQI